MSLQICTAGYLQPTYRMSAFMYHSDPHCTRGRACTARNSRAAPLKVLHIMPVPLHLHAYLMVVQRNGRSACVLGDPDDQKAFSGAGCWPMTKRNG